jgi:two-component system OmpR family sensor kinase
MRLGLPRSLRGRVIVVVLLTLAALLVALFVAVDVALRHRLDSELRTRLTDRAALARTLSDRIDGAELASRLTGDGVSVRLCGTQASCIERGVPVRGVPAPPKPGGGPRPRPPRPETTQVGDQLTLTDQLPTGDVLTLSADASEVSLVMSRLIVLEVVGGIVVLALAAGLLQILVGRALSPLDAMTRSARRIAEGDAEAQLELAPEGTELGRTGAVFDQMVMTLRRAEQRQRDLLSDAAHELRTPLAGISATAEILLREEPSPADRERLAASLVREAQRAGRLVGDLLAMARLDRGLDVIAVPLDVRAVLDEQLERVRALYPRVHLETEGTAPWSVLGDRERLAQVLGNLLDNACTAAGPTGKIHIVGRRSGAAFEIEVTDDGIGIPEHERERVFERLVRLDSSRDRASGGNGLGLTLARGLARAHGGDVTVVEANPGGLSGACLQLRLPAA